MRGMPELLHDDGIDVEDSVLFTLWLHYVANGEDPDVSAVFEVSGVDRLVPHFVKDLAPFGPFFETLRARSRLSPADVFVLVLFLRAADDAITDNVLDN